MDSLTGLNGVVYPSFAYQSELTMQIIFWIYKSFVSQFRRKNNSIIWACKVAETTKSTLSKTTTTTKIKFTSESDCIVQVLWAPEAFESVFLSKYTWNKGYIR